MFFDLRQHNNEWLHEHRQCMNYNRIFSFTYICTRAGGREEQLWHALLCLPAGKLQVSLFVAFLHHVCISVGDPEPKADPDPHVCGTSGTICQRSGSSGSLPFLKKVMSGRKKQCLQNKILTENVSKIQIFKTGDSSRWCACR